MSFTIAMPQGELWSFYVQFVSKNNERSRTLVGTPRHTDSKMHQVILLGRTHQKQKDEVNFLSVQTNKQPQEKKRKKEKKKKQ